MEIPLPSLALSASARVKGERQPRRHELEEQVVSLFEELRVPVLRYLLSRNVPAPDAEEIVQEVFLLLFEHMRNGGKANGNPAGWVFRAAHNFVLKHHDAASKQAQRFTNAPNIAEQIAHDAEAADALIEDAQRQQNLMAVVRALPDQDQKCLHLRAEGLRYREIAGVLGMSLGAVANSLQRSIARLKRSEER